MATETNFLAHDNTVQQIAGEVAQNLDEAYPNRYTRLRAESEIRRLLREKKGELDPSTYREYAAAIWQAITVFGQQRVLRGELELLRGHTLREYCSFPREERTRGLWRSIALQAIQRSLLQRGNVTETLVRKYEVALMRYCAQKIHERAVAQQQRRSRAAQRSPAQGTHNPPEGRRSSAEDLPF